MQDPTPTVGRIVHYRIPLSMAEDVNEQINQDQFRGSEVTEGEIVPMLITHVHNITLVNGNVFLDGEKDVWATSVEQGDNPGEWQWPARV